MSKDADEGEAPHLRLRRGELPGFELVDGRLVPVPPADADRAAVEARLTSVLDPWLEQRGGVALSGGVGYELATDRFRTADIGVHLAEPSRATLWLTQAPDLLVEIASATKGRDAVEAKAEDFFDAGTREAWIVEPRGEPFVEVRRPGHPAVRHRPPSALVSPSLPGFMLWLERVF